MLFGGASFISVFKKLLINSLYVDNGKGRALIAKGKHLPVNSFIQVLYDTLRPLRFSNVDIYESSTFNSANMIGNYEKKSLKAKEKRSKKVSVLRFL